MSDLQIRTEDVEPLLKKSGRRFVLFPIQYPKIWSMYKIAESSFWVTEDIAFHGDVLHWKQKLNDLERFFIFQTLAFLARSNNVVDPEPAKQFCCEVQIAEARSFYGFQTMMQNIHSETYSLLIKTFVQTPVEQNPSLKDIENTAWMKRKSEWAARRLSPDHSTFAERLVAFTAMKSIIFASSFAAIFWLKKRDLMPGITLSSTLVYRDIHLHIHFACLLFNLLRHRPPPSIIEQIIDEAIQIEYELLHDIVPVKYLGINPDHMSEFVQFVADELLISLGLHKLYHARNPFHFVPEHQHPPPNLPKSKPTITLPLVNAENLSFTSFAFDDDF